MACRVTHLSIHQAKTAVGGEVLVPVGDGTQELELRVLGILEVSRGLLN